MAGEASDINKFRRRSTTTRSDRVATSRRGWGGGEATKKCAFLVDNLPTLIMRLDGETSWRGVPPEGEGGSYLKQENRVILIYSINPSK